MISQILRRPPSHRAVLLGLTATLASLPVAAQCQLEWQPGPASPGPNGSPAAMVTAANGDLYVGGQFTAAGHAAANNIARFDGSDWHALGAGIAGSVQTLVILPNGDLVAGGWFETAGNAPARNIARWNGNDWSSIGSGFDAMVRDLAVLPNGNLVALGDFTAAGSTSANGVALWNGISWSALGSGPTGADPRTVTAMPNGDIVIGGYEFTQVPDLERWDGSSWSPLAGLPTNSITGVDNVLAMPNGDVIIDAFFFNGGILGRWDGTQVVQLTPPFLTVHDLAVDTNGDLLVLGGNSATPTPTLARFDGNTWTTIGSSVPFGYTRLSVGPNGSYHVGRQAQGNTFGTSNIAKLQFGQWAPLPVDPLVIGTAVLALPGGDVLHGGSFTEIDGVAANNIARRTATGYVPLAQGVDGEVLAMALAADGSVIVGGRFQHAGGTPAARIARWNGSSWTTLGAGLLSAPSKLAANALGEVLAVVGNQVHRFDGQTWSNVGSFLGGVQAITTLNNGDFLIAGTFITLGQPVLNGMIRITGGAASFEAAFVSKPLSGIVGDGAGGVLVTRVAGSGIAGSTLERYDGSNLVTVGTAPNQSLLTDLRRMPNGDLLAVSGAGGAELVRWDGSSWRSLPASPGGSIADLAIGERGEVVAAGGFVRAGEHVSVGFARATTPCPALVSTFGSGCVGSAGPVELSTAQRPWLGTTVEQEAVGMAPTSIAVHAIGLQTGVVPLPLGAPGCSLIVAPIFSTPLPTANGAVAAPLSIPNDPALIAQQVFTQIIGVELDPNINVTQLTASNALQFTVGAL